MGAIAFAHSLKKYKYRIIIEQSHMHAHYIASIDRPSMPSLLDLAYAVLLHIPPHDSNAVDTRFVDIM